MPVQHFWVTPDGDIYEIVDVGEMSAVERVVSELLSKPVDFQLDGLEKVDFRVQTIPDETLERIRNKGKAP